MNAGAHQMGRFCGSTLPLGGRFVTTHNAVYLWLRTDSSGSNQGFALHWNSVFPSCGGFLTGEHGRISSPGSPGRYPNNRDCIWEVMTTPGKRIQFHFFSVMMEEHPTCENDYLEVSPYSNFCAISPATMRLDAQSLFFIPKTFPNKNLIVSLNSE